MAGASAAVQSIAQARAVEPVSLQEIHAPQTVREVTGAAAGSA
jgi:hypothetical protein